MSSDLATMATDFGSGLSATRLGADKSDLTFVWHAHHCDNALIVTVEYGGGTATDNSQTVEISWGDNKPRRIVGYNPDINVDGNVKAAWGTDNKSYVVTFSGNLVRPGNNDILSSDMNNPLADKQKPLIVVAHLE